MNPRYIRMVPESAIICVLVRKGEEENKEGGKAKSRKTEKNQGTANQKLHTGRRKERFAPVALES